MYANRTGRLSSSGVPLVLDRFGRTLSDGRITRPLANARGLLIGLAAASPLWFLIVASLGGF